MAANPEAGTAELDASYLETASYNNREYQRYSVENQTYLVPCDEEEIARLDAQHEALSQCFDRRLIFPPITRLRRVLDCGYGTASWCIDVAEEHPRTEVIGVDINPSMQPDEIPNNLYLQVDDLNRRFTWPTNNFDIIHSRMVASGIHVNRWPRYLRDIWQALRPGGWCQMVEIYYNVQSDNGTLSEDHALRQWSATYFESLRGLKDLRAPLRLREMLTTAGFVDIEHRVIPLPTCGWPTEQRERNIGEANRHNVQRFLASMALYPFTERLGMPVQDAHLLIANARHEADNPAYKAYFPLHVYIGRKPRSRR